MHVDGQINNITMNYSTLYLKNCNTISGVSADAHHHRSWLGVYEGLTVVDPTLIAVYVYVKQVGGVGTYH